VRERGKEKERDRESVYSQICVQLVRRIAVLKSPEWNFQQGANLSERLAALGMLAAGAPELKGEKRTKPPASAVHPTTAFLMGEVPLWCFRYNIAAMRTSTQDCWVDRQRTEKHPKSDCT
jgi:hypothetical protein